MAHNNVVLIPMDGLPSYLGWMCLQVFIDYPN